MTIARRRVKPLQRLHGSGPPAWIGKFSIARRVAAGSVYGNGIKDAAATQCGREFGRRSASYEVLAAARLNRRATLRLPAIACDLLDQVDDGSACPVLFQLTIGP